MSITNRYLHKDIALLEQTWKGDEVAELKINRMNINGIYISSKLGIA